MSAPSRSLSPLAPYAATLLRLALGGLFLAHGLTKLLVFTPAGTAAYFQSLGLPGALGYFTIVAELGLATALLLGTIASVHGANGFSFANSGGGWEYPAFWALALVVLFLLGDGRWTLRSR